MKNFLKICVALIIGVLVISCEKDEDQAVLGEGTNPVLTSNVTTLMLSKDHENDEAIKFNWVNPKFNVQVAFSDALEFAKAGTNFESAKSVDVVSKDLSASYTVGNFNKIMLEGGFPANVANAIEVRLRSKVGNITMYSEVVSLTVTPYLTEFPSFYIVGDASAVGWNASSAQLLYKKDNFSTIYTYLENGKYFRFLGQQDWNPINYSLDTAGMNDSYKYFKTWSSNLVASPSENIQFTGATGMYKITINADAAQKTINVAPSPINNWNPANLYLVGTINGWDAGAAIPMTNLGNGKFEHTISLPAGSQFKFLGQLSWGDLDWGNMDGDGNTGYIAPKGSNGNIMFDGTGGSYKISVDMKSGVYKIQPL
ncbi:SusF/SusE family outer membrane protein [Chryseobacterium nematophagum]|uniref:SusF/SusE family outer membrane protein n=1 Tax=Chryseobacterium nematophagum TaxID=2305228 RepID=A0A3M7LAJ1_9FLAO|nr:SusE domain-containing protein [Chryseobacterium nematophagum]RMZ59773.1 SusF/SusE family outer membrane protein [Chryseobacterium nematophagum]